MATGAVADRAATRRRLGAIEGICETASDDDVLTGVASRVRRMVPFDAAFWSACDPMTGLATSPAIVENIAPEYCGRYWEHEFLEPDFIPFRELARAPRAVRTLHEATGGHPARSGRYRAVIRPSGLGPELRVAFAKGGRLWGMAALYREAGAPDFTPEETDTIEAVAGVLGDGLRRRALGRPGTAPGAPVGPGMLLFDAAGRVRAMNDEAVAWLDMLQPDPFAGVLGPQSGVHTEVLTVVHRARTQCDRPIRPELMTVSHRARAGVADGDAGGAARARVRGRNGMWLVVHGSRLVGTDEIAVVIEPAKGSEMAPIIAEAFALTAREQEIANAISRGEGTAEIAARLHLSPHTVRDHIKALFEKTAVRSRGELVARLFGDHYLPLIAGAAHPQPA